MAQDFFNPSVSDAALAIINKHLFADWFNEKPYQLLISLYVYRGNTDPRVLKVIQKSAFKLDAEEGDILCAEYNEVVSYLYKKMGVYSVNSRPNGSHIVPQSFLKICKDILSPEAGASVYIPFAGKGDYAFIMDGCSIDGTEISPFNWAVSQILFDAFKVQGSIRLIKDADRSCDFNGKAKYIIAEPPVGDGRAELSRCFSLVSTITEKLEDGGIACIVIPTGTLSSTNWKPLRSYMLDNIADLSSLVMAMPPLYMPLTAVELSLVVIRKQKNPSSSITFFNALDKSLYGRRPFNDSPYALDSYKIVSELHNPSSPFSVSVCPPAINVDTNFSADRFFVDRVIPKPKAGERLVCLSDLVDITESVRPEKGLTSARVVLMRNLSDKYLSSYLDMERIPKDDPKGCNQLFPGTLLVGYLGGKFKVGKVPENLSGPTFIRHEIVQLTLKSEALVSKDFLLRAIMSDYVKDQARFLDAGITITRLAKEDLLSLKILLPTKEEQDRQVFSDGVAGMSQADQEKVKFFSEFRKDMHMKKHAIGQTIFNLNNWLMNLDGAREECHGVLDDNAMVGGVVKIKVSDIYDNISLAMKILDRQISTLDAGYGMKSSSFSLIDFISDYISSHPYPRVRYEFNANNKAVEAVEFPHDALTIIVDNIVSNAVAHGFNDDKEHTIRFSVEVEGTNIVVSVANDGAPLPADQNPEDIFIYGVSEGGKNHLGIGAYQVRNLMREFDGDAEIVSNPHEEFTVTYRLIFTKTTLNDSE